MSSGTPTIDEIYWEASQIDSPVERICYLDRVCSDSPEDRKKIEKLLNAQPKAEKFLEEPAILSQTVAVAEVTEKPGDKIGNYKLLEQIGEGGMGVVYMADQTEPVKRRVALKIIKPGMDTKQVVARFEAERQALALMDHPNIARVLDAGATESPLSLGRGAGGEGEDIKVAGRPYFVMELVRGIPITEYCDKEKLTTTERLKLFITVCKAVQHAHQKGIIHRDIKPSNILVTVNDGVAVPKVIDFGVAKAINRELTEQTLFTNFATMIGTPLYMSPEQAEMTSLDIDTRSDIYSLGVLLYELLTGSTPFEREKLKQAGYDEMRRIIREDEPPNPSARISTLGEMITTVSEKRGTDPRKLSQTVRGDLDWIVMKALEKDRNRRYESASAFAADVNRYLNDEPIEAHPPSTVYRLKKFAKRKRGLLTGVSLVTITLLVSVVVGSILVWNERDEAIEQRTRAEKALEETRATIDKYVETIQNAELLKEPRFKPLMKELLKDALAHYERFVKEHEHDDSMLLDLSKAMFQVARISTEIGDVEEAIEAYRQVIEIRERLVRENPVVAEYRSELALSHHKIGLLFFVTGKLVEALVENEKALQIRERLARENPSVSDYKHGMAGTLHNMGNGNMMLGRKSEAIKLYRKALEISEEIVQENPDRASYREYQAKHIMALGSRLGNPDERLAQYQRALTIRKDLVRENPTITKYQSDLAETYNWIGLLYNEIGKPDEALVQYQELLKIREDLVRENPLIPDYKHQLAGALHNIGNLHKDLGRSSEAMRLYRKASEISAEIVRENPEISHYSIYLANHEFSIGLLYKEAGKPDDALLEYEKVLEIRKRLVRENPTVTKYQELLADSQQEIGFLFDRTGKPAEALVQYQKVIKIRKRLFRKNPTVSNYRKSLAIIHNDMAVLLAITIDEQIRDPKKAIEHTRKAIELMAQDGTFWNSLGVAHYQAGDMQSAFEALEKSMRLRSGGDAFDWIFLAMTEWRLGNKEKAREWYEKSVRWMEEKNPKVPELIRFRNEAASLLGLAIPTARPKSDNKKLPLVAPRPRFGQSK